MVSSDRGNASGSRRGDREDLVIAFRKGCGQRFAQEPLIVTENQSHVSLSPRVQAAARGSQRLARTPPSGPRP